MEAIDLIGLPNAGMVLGPPFLPRYIETLEMWCTVVVMVSCKTGCPARSLCLFPGRSKPERPMLYATPAVNGPPRQAPYGQALPAMAWLYRRR